MNSTKADHNNEFSAEQSPDLSAVIIALLKGVVYQENDLRAWSSLLKLQARIRDYVATLGLELSLDEAEGYAFLKSKLPENDEDEMPRLMVRRQLPYTVSLLLALLRKRLAEFDARGGDTRLVLTLDEIVDIVRVFLLQGSNEAKLINNVEAQLNKIIDLGFVKRLKPQFVGDHRFEVRRILKAFVDAQWLADFDSRLEQYQVYGS
ncbi:MAG: DUF4194 domain-containing protein, partial [Candidatus Obscuribacterales bacterium]|nr:DUF4194 domain-containing protein [Candidatus Obscuribacterales bacterium]